MTTSGTQGEETHGDRTREIGGHDVELDRLRPLAFSVAYRMLGSVAEAEDVVQEALTRVSQAEDVRNPDAFVTTVTTRISIDVLRSARVRRESYVGEWLPEPLVGPVHLPVAMAAPPPDAAAHAELADDLSTAFLVLLETLTPTERAAFLLHDVLGFPHSEAADVIGTTEVAARQLASRARRRIAERREGRTRDTTAADTTADVDGPPADRPTTDSSATNGPTDAWRSAAARSTDQPTDQPTDRPATHRPAAGRPTAARPTPGTPASRGRTRTDAVAGTSPAPRRSRAGAPVTAAPVGRAEELVTRFLAACEEGAVEPFLALLAEDVVLTGDSGGNVPRGMSIARPVAGREPVAKTLAGFLRYGMPVRFERALVGGQPGLLIVADDVLGGGLVGTWSFDVADDGRLRAIHGVLNPDKLRHLGPLADLERIAAWLHEARAEYGRRRKAARHADG
ncbi:sigma-70 family RNA polymerase sigma factor [Promicromonospora citrea]|uniref:RNA polymerase sigma-70 factor (ECF subfamily) n=1 Tax=Promicromonospora citrea TaxID=43677 RepID=A0A8H9GHR1_9MICO|nr:sigma-70 family RNA polymerase sigma factor [Promicromonospora citrea]GGM28924.1 hypothetical protein GCM10010102_25870 [Promicromonospora citrea]